MRTLCSFLLLTVLISTSRVTLGQTGTAKDSPRGDAKNLHGLIISGDGFVFLASEPEGWDTDTGQQALVYGSNAVFFPRAKDSRVHHVAIRIRVNDKTTEQPADDMNADVAQYKKRYPSTQFADLRIAHPEYKSSVKLFFSAGDFYEYVAYLNPGREHRLMFSVAMSKEKEAATKVELAAFEHVLRSLNLVGSGPQIRNK